jgi:hypothetical protein
VLPQIPTIPADQRKLLKAYAALEEQDRASLLAFAEFLAARSGEQTEGSTDPEPSEPMPIPRPDEESVVGAIKRLSESYFMLDRAMLLDETSELMTAHLVRGEAANEVIDRLEALFERHYREYQEKSGGESGGEEV